MTKEQQKITRYGNVISTVLQGTEAAQEEMGPKFDALRQAIDAEKLADFSHEEYAATKAAFTKGTNTYQDLLDKMNQVAAPARLLGNHKLMVGAYTQYVAGCQAMLDSLGDGPQDLDVPAFNDAEKAQDEASGKFSKYLERVQQLN